MFRSLWYKSGVTLKRSTAITNGESSSSTAKYFLFTFQNQNAVISNSRVTSIVNSFCTATGNNSSSSFVVSYLINSCGLSEIEAITASKQLNFKTKSQPDSVLTLLKSYGFTESHISKMINRGPSILLLKPDKTLKPKLDFFKSRGLFETDFTYFISKLPRLLRRGLEKEIIPSFDVLKSIVQSDENVIIMIRRDIWILSTENVKRVMVNVQHLRNEGVPDTNIRKYLVKQPRAYAENANRFKEIVEKVKELGFDHWQTTFLIAIHGLASMTEASWRKKMDIYKRWGWSEAQIQSAFRKNPHCMAVSEKKIMSIMNFLVDEMGYASSSAAENPLVFCYSLKERISPRCSVIKILVSKGLIKEKISLGSLSVIVDKSFLDRFVKKYELEVPELMEVFQGQLNYQQLLQN